MAMLKVKFPILCREITRMSLSSRSLAKVRMSAVAPAQLESENRSRRMYVDHIFYKGKCAMNMRLMRPTFKVTDVGDAVLSKEGTMMLEFAHSIGPRQYDWAKKQLFAVSVAELGQILSMTPADSLEFFHDPNMGKPEGGNVRKSLKIEPTSDRSGYFFNLTVVNKLEKTEARHNIPILKGEFAVLRAAAHYALPYLMGWHFFTENRFDEAVSGGGGDFVKGAPKTMVPPPLIIDSE